MTTTQDSSPAASRAAAADLARAFVLAVAGCAWLSWLRPTVAYDGSTARLQDAVAVLSYALPLVLVLVPLALRATRRGAEATLAVVVTCTVTAAAAVALGSQLRLLTRNRSGLDLATPSGFGDDILLLLVIMLPLCVLLLLARLRRPTHGWVRRASALTVGVAVTTMLGVTGVPAATAALTPAALTNPSCLAGGPVDKSFDVTALDVEITVNKYGDHDPTGKMYALTSAIPAIRAQEASKQVSAGLRDDPIQPLVIRANEGDCVSITFTNNSAGGDFGMHIDGLEFDVASSGDSIGANPTSAVAVGATRTYRFAIPMDPRLEGGHYIHPGPGYRQAIAHGLFGALVVEPPGSTYWNPSVARQPQLSGWEAIIKPAGAGMGCLPSSATPTCGFREAMILHHELGNDSEVLTNKAGQLIPVLDDLAYRAGSFALNYRSEPFVNRLKAFPHEKAHAYSSVVFGDPATPIMRGYLGDPTKIRIMHGGGEKFHIFHLHGGGDRWRFNPVADPTYNYAYTGLMKDLATEASPSQRLDSQSIGPGESYDLEVEGGAGGVQQSVGDFLFHCHISKHYIAGMWGLWRVYDTRQPDLIPLWDRTAPPGAVDSVGLLGRMVNGTRITRSNLDTWIRAQLPSQGIPRDGQDPTVWNWKVAGTAAAPVYLGAPADPTVGVDSEQKVAGQPNLLPVDVGHMVGDRPAILFNPRTGRPAYPLFRTSIGNRPAFTGSGHTGTPYLGDNATQPAAAATDPYARRADGLCPANRKVRTFNVVAIAKTIQRTPTVSDPDGKLFVLAHDKDATYTDPTKTDPLAIRANVGDCVAITLTSEIADASAFNGFSKTSMHIHHVQFDVQGSDGVSAGYAYENSVRPYKASDATLTAAAQKGDTVLHLSDVAELVGIDANGKPTRPWLAAGEGLESIDIRQVKSVDPLTNTVTLMTPLASDHSAGEYAGTEFIQSRWYADSELDNVFWHDHVDGTHGWGHGLVGQLIIEPRGSTYHDPKTGAEVDSGTLVDIHTSNPLSAGQVNGSFRELALWTINDNDLVNFSTLNLKANPLADRPDTANQFSSYTYGDPVTPLPRLYANDPLVVRTISISPTLDTLHVQGGRTLLEPRYTTYDANNQPVPEGTLIDTVHYGISEKFSLVFNGEQPSTRMRPGDYLYTNGIEFRQQQGAWGIVRILPGKVPDLRPLPGGIPGPVGDYVLPTQTGGSPPATTSPGDPCPAGAPARDFDLSAMDRSGGLNGARTAYVPSGEVPSIKARLVAPSPLVMHVVAGDCVTVHLTNLLTAPVGFSIAKLDRTMESGGVNVGFNSDQNTAPGARRDYVYYVDSEHIGSAAIADLAGGPATLKSGLYGAVIISPRSTVPGRQTTFSDPRTGAPTSLGAQVLVHVPGATPVDSRDFTVLMADDDASIGADAMPYPVNANAGRQLINYQHAPVGDGPDSFRDPGPVPWLTAYVGDPMTVHVLQAPGSESGHVFSLGGLRWQQDQFIPESDWQSAQGLGAWETIDAKVVGGAGGTAGTLGDLFYGDLRRPFTASGLWGLQRVLPAPSGPGTCPIVKVDASIC